jgi:hypothetical protein
MPVRFVCWRRWLCPAAALLLVGVFAFPVSAQELGTVADKEAFDNLTVKSKFMELVRNLKEYNPQSKEHADYIEKAAKFYVWPLTWSTVRNAADQKNYGFPKVHERFKEVMEDEATRASKNKEFMKAFVAALIPRFKEVLNRKLDNKTQEVTHCALMLQQLGKSKTDAASDFLVSIAKDPKQYHPFVRMCAIRGLGEIPGWGPEKLKDMTGGDPKVMSEKRAKDLERLETIKDFIYRPMQTEEMPANPSPEHVDAYFFLRREGVKALAGFQTPALEYDAKTGKVVGPAAFYLAMMFSRDQQGKYNLNLSERLEAAIGLCQLLPNDIPAYRAEVGLFLVGMTLAELGTEYIDDYLYFTVKSKDPKDKEFPPRQSKLPWKATKERLQQALDEMAKNLGKNSELGKTTDAMKKEAGQILEAMGKHGLLSRPQVSTFAAWVNSNVKLTPINVGGNKLLEIYTKNAELVIPPPQVGVQ